MTDRGPTSSPISSSSPAFPELTARFGPLEAMDTGMQSRVYRARHPQAGEVVVKIYRNRRGEHRLEAENMRRAGADAILVEALEADGVEVLITRRFQGHPLGPADVRPALDQLRPFLARLHAQTGPPTPLDKVRERLKRFRSALAPYPLDDLFEAVEGPLERGELAATSSFCHLDLWQDNILVNAAGEVLVIDWTRAAWDDPMRDLALFKTGTLDLLSPAESLSLARSLLPGDPARPEQAVARRFRAYLAHTYLHDLYWFLMNDPYAFESAYALKLPRARHALAGLPDRT